MLPSLSAASKLYKHPSITAIKIINRNSVTKTTYITTFQHMIDEENNDDTDWITIDSPKTNKNNKRYNILVGLSPKPKQFSSTVQLKQLYGFSLLDSLSYDPNIMETDQTNINASETKIHIPPPVFIKSNINYIGFWKVI